MEIESKGESDQQESFEDTIRLANVLGTATWRGYLYIIEAENPTENTGRSLIHQGFGDYKEKTIFEPSVRWECEDEAKILLETGSHYFRDPMLQTGVRIKDKVVSFSIPMSFLSINKALSTILYWSLEEEIKLQHIAERSYDQDHWIKDKETLEELNNIKIGHCKYNTHFDNETRDLFLHEACENPASVQ